MRKDALHLRLGAVKPRAEADVSENDIAATDDRMTGWGLERRENGNIKLWITGGGEDGKDAAGTDTVLVETEPGVTAEELARVLDRAVRQVNAL